MMMMMMMKHALLQDDQGRALLFTCLRRVLIDK